MRLQTATTLFTRTEALSLSLATTRKEIREVQRLRYKVFVEAGGLERLANEDRLDADGFDEHCDHLIVRDTVSLKVVGTYRLLHPAAARAAGQYYSESEFDLSRLDHLRSNMIEAGRACIHPKYRGGAVLMMLWSGLAAYMRLRRCDYLVGCASMSLADGGANAAAVFRGLGEERMAPPEYRVTPHAPFLLDHAPSTMVGQIPPLLRGYLRGGAWVCGAPAWDPEFHCADLFLLLPMERLEGRYARRYVTEDVDAE